MSATTTLKSAIRTAEAAGTGPGTASVTGAWQLPGLLDARVKVLVDSYTAVGSGEDAASAITFATLPTGATILGIVTFANGATSSLTISVGDADSAARHLAASATNWATAQMLLIPALGVLPGRVVGTSTNDNRILVTTAGAALTSGQVYGIMVFYSFD